MKRGYFFFAISGAIFSIIMRFILSVISFECERSFIFTIAIASYQPGDFIFETKHLAESFSTMPFETSSLRPFETESSIPGMPAEIGASKATERSAFSFAFPTLLTLVFANSEFPAMQSQQLPLQCL